MERKMRGFIILALFIVLGYTNASSQIVDVIQNGNTLTVKTEKGTNYLQNKVNSSFTLSGFNSKYVVVSCYGSMIYVYREDGSSVASIDNAICTDDSTEPKYVSNVTENNIIVKYRKNSRRDYYDFNGKFIKYDN